MCGIAGQVALLPDGEVDEGLVRRMVDALFHRGPDGAGVFVDPDHRVVMGMRRLAIIDLVSGDQPVFNEAGTVACVFNGEIYNFSELRRELAERGHQFRTNSDTEVIVHLYEEDGPDCVRRLRGMFAIALWDRPRQRLVLARDRLGKKPLYYAEAGGRLGFASEIHALYDLPGLAKTVDPAALDLYLTYSYIPAPHSIFQGIRKLPPAHVMVVEGGRVQIQRYWTLPAPAPVDASPDELVRRVRAKLEEAVGLRLISDVPLGCFLSGGVDSSSVVALMSRVSTKRVTTFSVGFTCDRLNELPWAREVARRYDTEHHEYVVKAEVHDVLPQIARHFGEPFGDASAVPTWYVSKLARQHVTVALNGDGGDELFGGYEWYRAGLTLDRLAAWWPGHGLARLVPPGRFGRTARRLEMRGSERFTHLRRFLDRPLKQRLYSAAFLQQVGNGAERFLADRYEAASGDTLSRMQHTDVLTYLPEDLLVKVDRMTMAHSLEGRSPLLDHELLECAAAVPASLKVHRGMTKIILREAVRELFPDGFLNRPKMGFTPPTADWLRGELRGDCERLITGRLAESGWFRPATLREMLDQHLAQRRDWSTQLWNLLMLGQWAELYRP
jgi:asparagine synthase (glutamine-hydrolysing)